MPGSLLASCLCVASVATLQKVRRVCLAGQSPFRGFTSTPEGNLHICGCRAWSSRKELLPRCELGVSFPSVGRLAGWSSESLDQPSGLAQLATCLCHRVLNRLGYALARDLLEHCVPCCYEIPPSFDRCARCFAGGSESKRSGIAVIGSGSRAIDTAMCGDAYGPDLTVRVSGGCI